MTAEQKLRHDLERTDFTKHVIREIYERIAGYDGDACIYTWHGILRGSAVLYEFSEDKRPDAGQ